MDDESVDKSMTLTEIVRLIDWLKYKGMSDLDAIECIRYIASDSQPDSIPDKQDN